MFQYYNNTVCLWNIMFISGWWRRSLAAVAPVKYECDMRYFCKMENFAYGEINEGSLNNFHLWPTLFMVSLWVSLQMVAPIILCRFEFLVTTFANKIVARSEGLDEFLMEVSCTCVLLVNKTCTSTIRARSNEIGYSADVDENWQYFKAAQLY